MTHSGRRHGIYRNSETVALVYNLVCCLHYDDQLDKVSDPAQQGQRRGEAGQQSRGTARRRANFCLGLGVRSLPSATMTDQKGVVAPLNAEEASFRWLVVVVEHVEHGSHPVQVSLRIAGRVPIGVINEGPRRVCGRVAHGDKSGDDDRARIHARRTTGCIDVQRPPENSFIVRVLSEAQSSAGAVRVRLVGGDALAALDDDDCNRVGCRARCSRRQVAVEDARWLQVNRPGLGGKRGETRTWTWC